jgi:tetratricopeptide (TPR) repeat protein
MILGFSILTFFLCLKGDMDTDLYWHMATGRWILENLQFPTEDNFSFIYSGAHWINLTWIFQIASHLSMELLDYFGVLLFCSLLYMGSSFFGWCSYRSMSQRSPALLTWILYCVLFLWIERRWVPRPEVWTHLFLTLEIFLLLRFCLKPNQSKSLWLIPPILLAWTNSHGMFILGLILFGFVLLRHPRRALAPFSASVLVTLVNPYGWEGATYPFYLRKVSADPVYRLIQEGMSFFDPGVSWAWYTMWGGWLLLLLLSLRPGFRVMGWVYFLWLAFAVYFSTTMVRNLSPAVVMTAPFILVGFENLWARISDSQFKKYIPYKNATVAVVTVLLCTLVANGKIEGLRENFHFGWKISENESLTAAGDFLESTTKSKIFATPEFNNYMLWRQPGFKTYIDTRYAEVVPRAQFQKMFQLFLNPVQIEQETVRHQLPVVAINHTLANYHGAIRYFLGSANWRPVYADHFMIFFFHKNHRPDIPYLNFDLFQALLQKEVNEWQGSSFWLSQTEKIKKIYQLLIAATLFRQEKSVLSLMASIEDKMDLKLNNLYCSILTYSARGLPNEDANKQIWARKAVSVCENVFLELTDQSAAYNRAAASYILNDLSSALVWVEKALKINSTIFGYHLLKAEILTALDLVKNFQEIQACYTEALRLNPFQPIIWKELIRIQKKYGSLDAAAGSLAKAKRFYPNLKDEITSSQR